jgi:NADH dehydrogenase
MGAPKEIPRILVVGGGYVGMYAALRMQKQLKQGEAEIVVVEPQPYMTYQPFLPEAAAGSISPRHVVVPLRRVLDKCRLVIGASRPSPPSPPRRKVPAAWRSPTTT